MATSEGDFVLAGVDHTQSEVIELGDTDLAVDVEPVDDPEEIQPEPVALGPRILIVDDEPDIRNVLKRAFESRGYDVTAAASGHQAIKLALEIRPDAIVCDVMLPEMDGWQIYHQLRADYRVNEARFLFLSAFPDLEQKMRAIGVDADAYVAKGTLLRNMIKRVDQLLEPRKMFKTLIGAG